MRQRTNAPSDARAIRPNSPIATRRYSLEQYKDPTTNFTYTRENINNLASPFDLADSYYPHFQAAVSPVAQGGGGAAGVMMAMNEVNGVPALASSQLIETLRAWGGSNSLYITTDGGNMIDSMCALEPDGHGYCPFHAPPCTRDECVTLAVQAGSDIADGSEYSESLADAVFAGNLTLGEAQQRLFYTMLIRFRLGLFDVPQPFQEFGAADVGAPATIAAAALAARESLVLLADGAGTLPFALAGGSFTVIGPAGDSVGKLISNYASSDLCPGGGLGCYESIAGALTVLGASVATSRGCASATTCAPADVAAAVAAASVRGTRVVLVIGLDQGIEHEQGDREDIGLPPAQDAMVDAVSAAAAAAGNALALVLVHGGALALPKAKAAGVAILDAFYPGPFGGPAIADALIGRYNPGGKLPYTVYDEPFAAAVSMMDMRVAAAGRTYRYHADSSPGGAPLWRFGFGLSYTTVAAAWAAGAPPPPLALTPAAPTAVVTVRVSNAGSLDGDTVVQAYFVPLAVAAPQPPFLPIRALFAFERVRVGAGGSADVSLTVDAALMPLTLSDGTRGPISGAYVIVVSLGDGGAELGVNCSLVGF